MKDEDFLLVNKHVFGDEGKALLALAWMYHTGTESVEKNNTKALHYFKKAGELGEGRGAFNAGAIYDENGNNDLALIWYKKAATCGDHNAMYNLGLMYAEGQGVPQDYSQALYWYKILAEQAKASALVALAGMYYDGHGVTQNYKIAYILINVADMLDTAKYSALAPSYIATKLSSTELKDAERISTQLQNSRNFGIDLRKFLDSHQ